MSSFTRNLAVAAIATILPALAGLALAPERTRALPHRVGQRVRDFLDDDESVEESLRRITARLEDLAHQIDAHGASTMDRVRDTSPAMRMLAGLIALLLIPAALAALLIPGRLRGIGDAGDAHRPRTRTWDDDLQDLESDLDLQRDEAVSSVSRTAASDT